MLKTGSIICASKICALRICALRKYAALCALAMLLPCMLNAQDKVADAGRLPDAPSAIKSSGYGALATVNGRLYRQPTVHDDLKAYLHEVVGPRAFLSAGVRSGIEQLRTKPVGWGQDLPGYAQRYGSAYGEAAIDNSVRFAMGAALHEDVRYMVCHHCPAAEKIKNAILSEFTARRGGDGHRALSPTPIVASFSGPLVAYAAWYPPGYDVTDAAKHSALGFGTRIAFKMIREFLADKDTKAEKAGKPESP